MSTPSSAQFAAEEINKLIDELGSLDDGEIAAIISKHTQGEEEWRPVISGNGAHEVSTMGRVRSFCRRGSKSITHQSKILLPNISNTGYPTVSVWRNGKRDRVGVHVLVAEAFIGPRPEGKQIAHWDGVKTNCRLTNLRYATRLENAEDDLRNGTRMCGERQGRSVLTEEIVTQCRERNARGESINSLSNEYEVGYATMYHAVKGFHWKHVGAVPPQPLPASGETPNDEPTHQSTIEKLMSALATERAARESMQRIIDHANNAQTGYGNAVTAEIERLQARAEAAESRISELEAENQNHAEHVLLERGLRQAAEVKVGDVAKALNAYPDSDLVSLATTLEAIRRKAEVVFPLLGECALLMKGLILGTEWEIAPQIKSHMMRLEERVCAALASVPAETTRTEQCVICHASTDDWVDPDWAGGRICRECETNHEPKESANPPQVDATLLGEWRHGSGHLICGTLRIATADFDTDPSEGYKKRIFDWIVSRLNAGAYVPEPQVDATLESIARELREITLHKLREFPTTSAKMFQLIDALSAHARKSQSVNERLLKAAKLVLAQCSFPSSRSWAAFNEVVSAAESAAPGENELKAAAEEIVHILKHPLSTADEDRVLFILKRRFARKTEGAQPTDTQPLYNYDERP